MKLYFAIVLIALLAIGAFATNEMGAYVKDYTTEILKETLPESFPSAQFSDFAALVTGQAPRYSDSDSPVPMTESMKRAQASVTFLTANQLPNMTPQINLVNTDAKLSLTQTGAAIIAIQGQDPCLRESNSLFDQVYTSNEQSLVFVFASSPNFTNSFCSKLPVTTTPPADGYKPGKSICATLTEFVGTTDEAFSKATDTDIAKAVSIELNTKDFSRLTDKFNIKVTDTEVIVNEVTYLRSVVDVDTIIRELAYITNVSAQLATVASITSGDAPDYYTFVISSTNGIENNTELIKLIDTVIADSLTQFATQYNNSLLSTVIQAKESFAEQSCAAANEVDPGVVVTTEQVRSYQIVLWLVITLIFVAVGGFSATMNMHILPDSALQGGVSTYWTQKRS